MAARENLKNKVRKPLVARIGRSIRELRQEKKLTQENLAELANVHPKYIIRLESNPKRTGKNDTPANPSISILADIVYALGLSLEQFMGKVE